MRRWLVLIVAVGVALLTMGIGAAVAGHANALATQRTSLAERAAHQAQLVDHYVDRASSVILLTANTPAFARFYDQPGTRAEKVAAGGPVLDDINAALDYLGQLYPGRIGEACFIDDTGAEIARVVRGERAPADDMSLEEHQAPFFTPSFALREDEVYHAKPYVSPDTDEWVIANATRVPGVPAIVHFEVTIESFRVEASTGGSGPLLIVDADTGTVIMDASLEQRVGAPLGTPGDTRFAGLTEGWGSDGTFTLDGRTAAYQRIADSPTNDNHWYAVTLAERATTPLTGAGPVPGWIIAVALLFIGYAAIELRRRQSHLVRAAHTDPLTGLPNRRKLATDLAVAGTQASSERPVLLALYDLNGFKAYNDTFGHPAGDALLARLGVALAEAVRVDGTAYRLGGDEFCVLTTPGRAVDPDLVTRTVRALSEQGDGFSITAAHGIVLLPSEASDPDAAMHLVDLRMYEQKAAGRISPESQTIRALVRTLHERDSSLSARLEHTGELAGAVARQLGLSSAEEDRVAQAARIHDVGKVAIPDEVLNKPSPLNPAEWAFVRQCPNIGERIAIAAPALAALAPLIRSARERFDGTGYPDNLTGEQIPLASRIIAACSALAAMTASRPYAPARSLSDALLELRECAGTQFDPRIVDAIAEALSAVDAR